MSVFDQAGRVLPARPTAIVGPIDRRAVYAAAILGFLVNLNALLIPIFQNVGGGLVGGFVAGYAGGRPLRGLVHGTLAAAIVGAATGVLVLLNRIVVGLFIEPPALLLTALGPVSPAFAGAGLLELLFVYFAVVLAVAFDGLVAGTVGGALKAVVRGAFGES